MISYVLPIFVSLNYLITNETSTFLVAYSCLLLDFKFLSFFRILSDKYNMYFSIVLKVGKRLRYFLIFLVVQIISFAHAFHILLRPTSPYSLEERTLNDDPNNPWNLVSSYYQISENGAIKTSFIQAPDEQTNMFTTYRDSLYAMYLFLIGIDLLPFTSETLH